MKNLKTKAFATVIIAILTISMGSIALSNAHTPAWNIPTYAYCSVAPNPAGLGQLVTIGMWVQIPPPTAAGTNGDRWHGFKVTITDPDGTNQTLGPFTSDATGGTWTSFTPNKLGNYSFQVFYPGETMKGENKASQTNAYIGDYFMPSISPAAHLTVQEDVIPLLPVTPLPTSYWTRPIQAVNYPWYQIGGNWLGLGAHSFAATGRYNATGNYNPYSNAPLAPHVMWTKPVAFGGLMGGEYGGDDTSNFYSTSQYEPKWAPIIINGIMYYVNYPGSINNPTGWTAVNLRTGEQVWTREYEYPLTSTGSQTILRCGQVLDMVNPNQFGGIAYLWSTGTPNGMRTQSGSTTWNMFDAMTGEYILSIVNGTGLNLVSDAGGNLIGYYVNSSTANAYGKPTLNCWNSTQAIFYPNSQYVKGTTSDSWSWRPAQNSTIDFTRGIMWSKPLATNMTTGNFPENNSLSINRVDCGVVLMTATAATFNIGSQVDAAYSADTGEQLWIANRTLTPFTRDSITKSGYGMYYYLESATGKVRAYNIYTGALVWGPIQLSGDNGNVPVPNAYNSIGGYQTEIADGILYIMGFGGDIWAIEGKTGTEVWYTSTNKLIGDAGSDTPYGVWPLWVFSGGSIAGGVYFLNVGHEYSPPLFRGAKQLAINITDGSLVWEISGFDVTNAATIVDGYATVLNAYDNQLYTYGKGPSQTTVQVGPKSTVLGNTVVIEGTITDIAAGTKQDAQAANFPGGLPCVSDASMNRWMEYVYMQQPMPTDTTGVPITLSVVDANGNYRTIGSTVSDASGTYAFNWTPDISGAYTVYASFEGSESYYPSNAATHFYASEPAATPTPQPTAPNAADLYLLPGIIGIIIAIAVVGAVLALLVTKKP
jgi:hypothetical protein